MFRQDNEPNDSNTHTRARGTARSTHPASPVLVQSLQCPLNDQEVTVAVTGAETTVSERVCVCGHVFPQEVMTNRKGTTHTFSPSDRVWAQQKFRQQTIMWSVCVSVCVVLLSVLYVSFIFIYFYVRMSLLY